RIHQQAGTMSDKVPDLAIFLAPGVEKIRAGREDVEGLLGVLAEKEAARLSLPQDRHVLSGAYSDTHWFRAGPAGENASDVDLGHLDKDPGPATHFDQGECVNRRLVDVRDCSRDDRVGEGHA